MEIRKPNAEVEINEKWIWFRVKGAYTTSSTPIDGFHVAVTAQFNVEEGRAMLRDLLDAISEIDDTVGVGEGTDA